MDDVDADGTQVAQTLLTVAGHAQELETAAENEEGPTAVPANFPQADPGIDGSKQLAANSIEPNCAQHIIKDWKPFAEKPAHKHLLAAMGEQGCNRVIPEGERKPSPSQWPVQKIANWLFEHPKPAGEEATVQGASPTQQVPAAESAQSPPDGPKSKDKPVPPPTSDRWTMRAHGCRMLTLLCRDDHLRRMYLIKDHKFTTRAEKDVGDKDSFYVDLAKACNDPDMLVPLYIVESSILKEKISDKGFTTQPSDYIFTPETVKKKLTEIISSVRQALGKFQQSGMGDCPTDDKLAHDIAQSKEKGVSVEASTHIYSTDFHNFTFGDLTTAYAYELLLHYDMLLKASGTMPKEAAASSMGAANPTSRPACRKKNNTHSLTMSRALHRLGKEPLQIKRSQEELEAMRVATLKSKFDMRRELSRALDDVDDKIEIAEAKEVRARKNGSTPPNHSDKMARWQAEKLRLAAELTSMERSTQSPSPGNQENQMNEESDDEEDNGEEDEEDDAEESDRDRDSA